MGSLAILTSAAVTVSSLNTFAASTAPSISNILAMATELFTWVITQMGTTVTFIMEHPLVLFMFLMVICGFAVGMLMRIWKSVG